VPTESAKHHSRVGPRKSHTRHLFSYILEKRSSFLPDLIHVPRMLSIRHLAHWNVGGLVKVRSVLYCNIVSNLILDIVPIIPLNSSNSIIPLLFWIIELVF